MDTQQVIPSTPSAIDPFLKKWNWGAFLLSWIWAFGHGLALWGVIALAAGFVPGIGSLAALGIAIYLGVKGNELAWETGKYASLEVLRETEKKWTKWAIIVMCVVLAVTIVALVAIFMLVGLSATTSTSEFFMFL